jgi:hypothetical protein
MEDVETPSGSHSDEEEPEANRGRDLQGAPGGEEPTPETVKEEIGAEEPSGITQRAPPEEADIRGEPMEETLASPETTQAPPEAIPNLRAAVAVATGLEGQELPPEPLTIEEALQGPYANK